MGKREKAEMISVSEKSLVWLHLMVKRQINHFSVIQISYSQRILPLEGFFVMILANSLCSIQLSSAVLNTEGIAQCPGSQIRTSLPYSDRCPFYCTTDFS